MKTVLILGATSAIARATAAEFAAQGYAVYLAGRDSDELQRDASNLSLRYGIKTYWGEFDAEQTDQHAAFLAQVVQVLGSLDGVLLAFGYMGQQKISEVDFVEAERVLYRNFIGAASILTHCAHYLAAQKHGFIIGLSSVAGDRGRQSNYVYGSAKAGLSAFLQGLRNRLFSQGVQVMTVKPGFVDTAMTFGMPGLFLVASPQSIARQIVRALGKQRNVVYLPGFWRYIMLIIRHIPEGIFKRMKL